MMDPNLLKAILAMDTYNRGYDVGLEISVNGGHAVGSAQFFRDRDRPADVSASFYAAAYTVGTETIISYRGTDTSWYDFSGDTPDWLGGAGFYNTDQARLAAEFYRCKQLA